MTRAMLKLNDPVFAPIPIESRLLPGTMAIIVRRLKRGDRRCDVQRDYGFSDHDMLRLKAHLRVNGKL